MLYARIPKCAGAGGKTRLYRGVWDKGGAEIAPHKCFYEAFFNRCPYISISSSELLSLAGIEGIIRVSLFIAWVFSAD